MPESLLPDGGLRPIKGISPLQGVTQAMEVLNLLAKSTEPLSPRVIAQKTGINRTSTYRILETFDQQNIIEWTDERTVRAGIGLLKLVQGVLRQHPVMAAAMPILTETWQTTQESVSLNLRFNWEVFRMVGFESPLPLRVAILVGDRWPLHVTARGRVVLAFASVAQRRHYYHRTLQKYTAQTVVEPDALEQISEKIRELGYAISMGEMVENAGAIAAPVFYQGRIMGSIDVAGPTARIVDNIDPLYIRQQARRIVDKL